MDVEAFLAATSGHAEATRRRTSADRPNRLATIDTAYHPDDYQRGVLPRVMFDGEHAPTRKRWPVVGSYWPHPGDRVVMLPVGKNEWVILGSVSSEDGAALHTSGPVVAGNMVAGTHTFQAPADFTSVSAGRMAETTISYGPLPGLGPTRVFVTPDSASGTQINAYAHSISASGAMIRLIDTFAPDNSNSRIVQWLAVRGVG